MRKPRSAYNYLGRAADKKRGELLGMSFGTAQRQLQKAIVFSMAVAQLSRLLLPIFPAVNDCSFTPSGMVLPADTKKPEKPVTLKVTSQRPAVLL